MNTGKETLRTNGWKVMLHAFHLLALIEMIEFQTVEGHCFLE
jgi:hypothetical protein